MEIYKGTTVSNGQAYGKILFFCSRENDFSKETTDDCEYELQNLRDGITQIENSLKANIAYLEENGRTDEVVLTQARILLMHDIIDTCSCEDMITNSSYTARRAVFEAATSLRIQFENLDDDFMRERVADIKQISEMLLKVLDGKTQEFPHLDQPTIIVADELIPEGTLCFERQNILGIVIKNSTYNSHASILARLWNIPALAEISGDTSWNDHFGIIDANSGILYIDPDDETKNHFADLCL